MSEYGCEDDYQQRMAAADSIRLRSPTRSSTPGYGRRPTAAAAVAGYDGGRDRGRGRQRSPSSPVLEQDVSGQLAHSRPVLNARRHDLVDRKLKSSRAGVAQLDEVRVPDADDGARPVRRPTAEYVCNITGSPCV